MLSPGRIRHALRDLVACTEGGQISVLSLEIYVEPELLMEGLNPKANLQLIYHHTTWLKIDYKDLLGGMYSLQVLLSRVR
jgi:hypothetical protein